jgi:hypothetical protein
MWATRGDAKPIASVYADNGVHLTPAGKGARVPGWQRLRSYLGDGPACPHHRALGWDECPMLHMFSTLTEFYRTLSDLPHATKGDPEDADSDGDDHLPDAARYLLINVGGGAEAWIQWARRKAEAAAAGTPEQRPAATPEPQPEPEPVPEVPEDPVAVRKAARDAAYRAQYR